MELAIKLECIVTKLNRYSSPGGSFPQRLVYLACAITLPIPLSFSSHFHQPRYLPNYLSILFQRNKQHLIGYHYVPFPKLHIPIMLFYLFSHVNSKTPLFLP